MIHSFNYALSTIKIQSKSSGLISTGRECRTWAIVTSFKTVPATWGNEKAALLFLLLTFDEGGGPSASVIVHLPISTDRRERRS